MLFSPTADVQVSSHFSPATYISCPCLPCLLVLWVIALVRATVNHFCTASSLVKLTSARLGGSVQSQYGVHSQAAKSSWAEPHRPSDIPCDQRSWYRHTLRPLAPNLSELWANLLTVLSCSVAKDNSQRAALVGNSCDMLNTMFLELLSKSGHILTILHDGVVKCVVKLCSQMKGYHCG